MAGVGFEIKKIYDKKGFANKISGFLYAAFISVGPTLSCISMLLFIRWITGLMAMPFDQRELLNSAIMYAFIFSLIFVSGTSIVLSRYISDNIYKDRLNGMFTSLIGITAFTCLTSGVIGGVFYLFSALPNLIKVFSYLIYLELSIIFIYMVFVSAIREYKKITLSFLLGVGTIIVSSFVLLEFSSIDPLYAILGSVTLGFLAIILIILSVLFQSFDSQDHIHYEFIAYLMDYPKLYFINFFYTLGLFIHNFIFWGLSDLQIVINNTFVSAPEYDMATFYSVLTIMPSIILFVLKIETTFYVKYREFLSTIVNGGSLKDLKQAKANMIQMINSEIVRIMEIQLVITVFAVVVFTQFIFPYFNVSARISSIFTPMVFGYFLVFMAFLITTILLYFDAQFSGIMIQGTFLLSNGLFTYLSVKLGPDFYGFGIALSGLVTLGVAFYYFRLNINKIDYLIFSQQMKRNTRGINALSEFIRRKYDKTKTK